MDDFIKMDIFFAVATVAAVLLALLIALVLFRFYRILRNVERISDEIVAETLLVRGDVAKLRDGLQQEGVKLQMLLKQFTGFLQGIFRRRRK